MSWSDRGKYFELMAPQRSPEWFKGRQCRATASTYEKLMGFSRPDFGTPEEERDIIVGRKPPKATNENMERGKVMEEPTRDYFHGLPPGSEMYEPSLCVGMTTYDFPFIDSVWPAEWQGKTLTEVFGSQAENPFHPNFFIGGSPDFITTLPDGSVKNGEIKFPKKMYDPLLMRATNSQCPKEIGWYPTNLPKLLANNQKALNSKYGYNRTRGVALPYGHLWTSHLYQMTGCMAVTQNKSCYYVVGSFEPYPGMFYWEELSFEENLWHRLVYPSLILAVETLIKPMMTAEQVQYYTNENKMLQSITSSENFSIVKWIGN